MNREQEIGKQVQERAEELLPDQEEQKELEPAFVKSCLDSNERGDGVLYASLHRGKFLYNTTPKDGEWYVWMDNVWEKDDFRQAFGAAENCAIEYLKMAADLQTKIVGEGVEEGKKQKHWMVALRDGYKSRAKRLRNKAGASAALIWAPVVDMTMACRESDFDRKPWLLPVKNGVVDLKTGALISGRPSDMLTRRVDVEYDPRADYTEWLEFLADVCHDEHIAGSEEIPNFLQRVFGYAATGNSHEQYIFVFIGPGRNGKGILFNMIAEVMGPYYHEISRGMLLEQRNEPSPNAASEHKYSLLGKRVIVGAETNKGQKIDGSAIKGLTGEDKIVCRPLFGKEINFDPTHTLFLHTNHLPFGLTRDFAMIQRLLLIEFPHMYVDDVEAEAKKHPGQAQRFRQKDANLKEKLRKCKQGILRWIVEGCVAWQKEGLKPPDCILKKVDELATEEDYVGQFITDCLLYFPEKTDLKLPCTAMYDAFQWWWSENMDAREQRVPAMKTINKSLRDRGFSVDKQGGRTVIHQMSINFNVARLVDDYVLRKSKDKS